MADRNDRERIEALRERLYSRGKDTAPPRPTFDLSAQKPKVAVEPAPQTWEDAPEAPVFEPEPVVVTPSAADLEELAMTKKKKKRSYRIKVVLAGLGFFILAVGISSLFLLSGSGRISGENITISVTGPFTIGGGEVLPLQVGVTNANAVAIEAATLIIEYPDGTQSATDAGKELFIERLPLDVVGSGETLNIPIRALVFGEENVDRTVKASIEYRVAGSNATFFKEADPLRFKISSSPVVLEIEALKRISSGQETDITLKITSNSPTPLRDILVKATYPDGFDFTDSSPEAVAGTNTWLIEELQPEGSASITIDGIVVGTETDELFSTFSVGISNERDPFSLASVFTTGKHEFEIEEPFIDVGLKVANYDTKDAIVKAGEVVTVNVVIENTLDTTLYDAVVETQLAGNAISDIDVRVDLGFYDSRTNKIIWDQTSKPDLETVFPGDVIKLDFTFKPDTKIAQTPQIDYITNVRARRVSESDVPEELVGSASGGVKVSTDPQLFSESRYSVGTFKGRGPIPPVVEEETVYTLSLLVDNGTNNLSDAEVTASLPSYVNWLDVTSGDGRLNFNDVTRVLTWKVGTIDANDPAVISFQVSILPSTSQIDTTPTLMGEQRLKATDDFTGSVIRSSKAAVTTELSPEAGYEERNGQIQAN